jgi:serine/threonine-protein kinase RsbW
MASSDRGDARADVELRLPACRAYASVLRTTAAALVARLDFTIDDIEDVRIAIGEATTLVLEEADPGADLVCGFRLGDQAVDITLSTGALGDPGPDRDSFAWQLLDALAPGVWAGSSGGVFTVRFTMSSVTAVDAGGGRRGR